MNNYNLCWHRISGQVASWHQQLQIVSQQSSRTHCLKLLSFMHPHISQQREPMSEKSLTSHATQKQVTLETCLFGNSTNHTHKLHPSDYEEITHITLQYPGLDRLNQCSYSVSWYLTEGYRNHHCHHCQFYMIKGPPTLILKIHLFKSLPR